MKLFCIRTFCLFSLALLLIACPSKKEGAVEGTVIPPNAPAHVTAMQEGKNILSALSGTQDGKFRLPLPAGTYTISVTTPSSPYPLRISSIVVRAGETTTLAPIELAQTTGTSIVCGQISPPRPDAQVKLLYEGRERAAVHADREGKYEFKELPAGNYTVQANAPGHADDSAQVVVTENQKVEQNALLLPISSIDGVDWAGGKIRAVGVGVPPQNVTNETVRREMTKRAALADAQRNLLRTVEQIRIDGDKNVKTVMSSPNIARKVEGFLKGYTLVSERTLEDGKVEVVLELPLNGPAGLSRYVSE